MPQQPKSKEKEGIQVLTIISKLIKSIQTYPKLYLFILYFLLIIAPLIGNIFSGNVLLKGEESYYHINQAKSITIHNWQYTPLYLAHKYLPLNALALLPRILGLITIYYLYLTLKKIHQPKSSAYFSLTINDQPSIFICVSYTFLNWPLSLLDFNWILSFLFET